MSDRTNHGEEMTLDFDGWLVRQEPDIRNGIESHLRVVPEGGRQAEKQKLASMFAVSEETGIDLGTVNDRWNEVRGGYAEQVGGDWLAAKDDDVLFGQRMVKHATDRRDERYLLQGKPADAGKPFKQGDTADYSGAFQEAKQGVAPLLPAAMTAAMDGKPVTDVFAAWQQTAVGKPGYSAARAGEYFRQASIVHAEMKARAESVLPAVNAIMGEYVKAFNEQGSGYGGPALVDALEKVPVENRPIAIALLQKAAAKHGAKFPDKAEGAKAFGRGVLDMGNGMARKEESKFLEAADTYLASVKPGDTLESANVNDSSSIGKLALLKAGGPGTITGEQIAAAKANVARQWDRLGISLQLEQIGNQAFDPLKGGGFFTDKIYHPFMQGMAPQLALTALTRKIIPPGALAPMLGAGRIAGLAGEALSGLPSMYAMHGLMADQNAQQLLQQNPEMKISQAYEIGRRAAVAQSGMEYLQMMLGMGLVGKGKSLGKELLAMQGSAWRKLGVSALAGAAEQNAIEGGQDILPQVFQAFAKGAPGVNWDAVFYGQMKADGTRDGGGYWAQRADTFWAVLPLVVFGAGGQAIRDNAGAKQLSMVAAGMTDTQLNAVGIPEAQRAAILAESDPVARLDAFDAARQNADPVIAEEGAKRLADEQAAAERATVSAMRDAGVAYVQRTGAGWQVVEDNGQTHTLPTSEAAADMIHAIGLASTQREADSMIAIADELDTRQPGMKQRLSGDTIRGNAAGEVTTERGGAVVNVRSAGASAAELARELEQAGYLPGQSAVIQGSNWISEDGARVSMVSQGSAPVLTQVHEFTESRFKEVFAADGGASAVAAARVVAPFFDPAKATNPADKAFSERLQSIAAGRVNGTPEEVETTVRETMIDLVVADTLGRRKDGSRMPAGSITNAVLDRIRMYGRSEQAARETDVASGAQLPLLKKFAGILKAVRHYLRGVFTVAAKLQKARRDGLIKEGDDFHAFADKLLGLDTVKAHEAAVVREAGRAESFSVQPPLFSEDNRLTKINPSGGMMARIRAENPGFDPAAPTVKVYRASIGATLRLNDFVAMRKAVADDHMQNLKDRGDTGATVTEHTVKVADLLMGNDATEFVWYPEQGQTFSIAPPPETKSPDARENAGAMISSLDLRPDSLSFQSAPVSGRLPDSSGGETFSINPAKATDNLRAAQEAVKFAADAVRQLESFYQSSRQQWGEIHGRGANVSTAAVIVAAYNQGSGILRKSYNGWSETEAEFAGRALKEGFTQFAAEDRSTRNFERWRGERIVRDGDVIIEAQGFDFKPWPIPDDMRRALNKLSDAEIALFLAEEDDGGRAQRLADKETAGEWARRTKAAEFAALLDARDDVAKNAGRDFVSAVWSAFARHDEIFQFGRTKSKSAAKIAAAVSAPGRPVRAVASDEMVTFSGKDGSLDIHDADTGTPYIRSTDAHSKGKKGGGGSQLYAAALDWIHNNKKVITDDPGGLSDINAIRRTSNFFASALRWGTTRHLSPHQKQQVAWTGSDVLNTAALATKEMDRAFSAIAEARGWVYDFSNGEFRDQSGNNITREGFESAVRMGNPGESGIGFSTLQRAVITNSAIQAFERGEAADYVLEAGRRGIVPVGASYSIGSVNTLEAIAAQFEARLAEGGPAVKLEAYADTARTLAGMARAARANEETEIILRVGEIEKERPKVQARLEREYTDEVYKQHGDLLSQGELASVFENPLIDYLFRKKEAGKPFRKSRILSKAAALRQGIEVGNQYDGIDGLPKWMFSADGTVPDKLTKELAETGQFGLPEDATADADLWPAVLQALQSAEKYRKAIRRIEGEIMEAKDRARVDAREWANKERWKTSTSDARDSRRAIVTLDAMLTHLPAEVRAKVGGFTAITDLKSNDARRRHFLKMVDRIDVALEDYLRKEYVQQIREEIQKGQARKVLGQKDKGKLGVNAHTWLETASAVMRMDETRLSERESHIDAIMGGKDMTPEEIKDLNRAWDMGTGEDAARLALETEQGILDLFGGVNHRADGRYVRSAGELAAALAAVRETVDTGRKAWDTSMIERRERRAGRRAGVKIDSKNDGSLKAANPDALPEKVNELRFHYQMASTEQLAGYIFGRKSDTHLWIEDEVLTSRLTTEGIFQDAQRKVSELLDVLWPRTGRIGRIHNLEKLSTRATVPGADVTTPKLSEMDVIHWTMLWADTDSRNWLRKHNLGDGEPLNPEDEKGVDVQAAFEAYLSPDAKAIRAWLQDQYDAQYDTLNAVFRRLHGVNMPRVRNYAPRMVLHGKETAVIDPMGGGGLSARGVFAGFTKRRRPDVRAAPVVANALAAYMQNQRVVSHFVGWAESSGDLRAALSTSETAPFILGAAGPDGVKALNLRLSDLEANGVRDAMALAFHGEFMRALADNALIGKIAPILKQSVNVLASSTELGFGRYARSLRRVIFGKAAATMKEVSEMPIMKQRAHNMDPEILQASYGVGLRKWSRRLRSMRINTVGLDLSLSWLRSRMGWADAFFNLRSAAIAYDAHYLDAKELKMDEAEARAYALKEMTRTVSRTSQPDNAADRSLYENHSSKPAKVLFAFQTMNRAMLSSTIASFKAGDIPAFARKAFVFWAVNGMIMQMIASAIKDLTSDDDEDEDWKVSDFIRSMALGPMTGALYVGPLIDAASSWISEWAGVGGFEPREASMANEMSKAKHAVESIVKMFGDDFPDDSDFDTVAKKAEAAARGAGFAGQVAGGGWWSGLNVMANVWRQGKGFVDNVQTTPAEVKERKAKLQDAEKKEAEEAAEALISADQRKAKKEAKAAKKAAAIDAKSARYDALHPGKD